MGAAGVTKNRRASLGMNQRGRGGKSLLRTAAAAGLYRADAINANGVTASRQATLRVVDVQGAHALAEANSAGYRAGAQLVLSLTVAYSGQPGSVAVQVLLPAGWSFASETSRGAEQTISTGKYEVTGRGGKGRELLQRGQFTRVIPNDPEPPQPLDS